MGLHRRAAKRDDNEPEIRKAFARHGWHTETMSAPGMPDLLAMKAVRHFGNLRPTPTIILVDVKAVDGTITKPQREKWKALSEKGIPVYVCRTETDVDALVRGELEPWRPEAECDCGYVVGRLKTNGGHKATCATHYAVRVTARGAAPRRVPGMGHGVEPLMREESSIKARTRSGRIPPRSTPVDAAKEAAEPFAPPVTPCERPSCTECGEHTP